MSGDDDDRTESLLEIVCSALEERKVRFGRNPNGPGVLFLCPTPSAIFSGGVQVQEKRAVVRCVVFVGCRVPAEKRQAAAELFTRINYGLPLGAFEMDFSDGEIGFRAAIDVTGGELTVEVADTLMSGTVATVDRYHPAIMSFLFNDMAPEDAVAMIEGVPHE